MKKASELLPADPSIKTHSPASKRTLSGWQEKYLTNLFGEFSIKYGPIWTARIPEDRDLYYAFMQEWGYQLRDLSVDQIIMGMLVVTDHYKEYPPQAHQFRDLCKMGDDSWETVKVPKLDNPTKQETFEDEVKKMKELLK